MDKFQGLIGVALILGIAFLFSNNKKNINYRLVVSGLALQLFIGILVLKIPAVTNFFQMLGKGMGKIEEFSRQGAAFVYGGISATTPTGVADFANGGFIFAFNVTATIILVCVLVALLYHFGVMQRIVVFVGILLAILEAALCPDGGQNPPAELCACTHRVPAEQ